MKCEEQDSPFTEADRKRMSPTESSLMGEGGLGTLGSRYSEPRKGRMKSDRPDGTALRQ